MSGTIEFIKCLGEEAQIEEVRAIVTAYAPRILKQEQVRALMMTIPATGFEITAIELASVAVSDLACQVRLAWSAMGDPDDLDNEGDCVINGVATGLIDDEAVLRFTDVKVSLVPAS